MQIIKYSLNIESSLPEKTMSLDIHTLIWLFPIAFMFHDFEELIFGEPWLGKNAGRIKDRIKNIAPAWMTRQVDAVFNKSTSELAFPISLIFGLTFISSYLAVEYGKYVFLILAGGTFFLHGFMHLGQAIILRKYIPAVISSVLIVIPYGLTLFWKLIAEGIIDISGLSKYFLLSGILTIPFILVMHKTGDYIYKKMIRLLIG